MKESSLLDNYALVGIYVVTYSTPLVTNETGYENKLFTNYSSKLKG